MKIEVLRRGINKDEVFCGNAKDIKDMLNSLSLDDSYRGMVDMGSMISRENNREAIIFNFWYSSRFYEDIDDSTYRRRIWFEFYPFKKKDLTEELTEEFKNKVIPLLKQEILLCIKRNDIIDFVYGIKILIKNGKLEIIKDKK